MEMKEVQLTEEILDTLMALSLEWQNEDISYGYYCNEKEDIMNKRIFLAIEKNAIIGYLFGHKKTQMIDTSVIKKDVDYFEIDELYISKKYRSKGVGKELMDYVEKVLKSENIKQIQLTTSTKNYKAILHFYIEEIGMTFWSARLFKSI